MGKTLLLVTLAHRPVPIFRSRLALEASIASCLVNRLLGGFPMTHWACGVVTVLDSDMIETFCSIGLRNRDLDGQWPDQTTARAKSDVLVFG